MLGASSPPNAKQASALAPTPPTPPDLATFKSLTSVQDDPLYSSVTAVLTGPPPNDKADV